MFAKPNLKLAEALEDLYKSCEEWEKEPHAARGPAALLILKGLIRILIATARRGL